MNKKCKKKGFDNVQMHFFWKEKDNNIFPDQIFLNESFDKYSALSNDNIKIDDKENLKNIRDIIKVLKTSNKLS